MADVIINAWCFGCWAVGVILWYPIYERLLDAMWEADRSTPLDNFERGISVILSAALIIGFPLLAPVVAPLPLVFFGSKWLTKQARRVRGVS